MNSIKENLHSIIDSFDDEDFLRAVYEILQSKHANQPGKLWETLTDEQKKTVINSAGDTSKPEKRISHESMLIKNKKWLKE